MKSKVHKNLRLRRLAQPDDYCHSKWKYPSELRDPTTESFRENEAQEDALKKLEGESGYFQKQMNSMPVIEGWNERTEHLLRGVPGKWCPDYDTYGANEQVDDSNDGRC